MDPSWTVTRAKEVEVTRVRVAGTVTKKDVHRCQSSWARPRTKMLAHGITVKPTGPQWPQRSLQPGQARPGRAGPGRAGPGWARPGQARPDQAGQGRAWPAKWSRVEQTGAERVKPSWAPWLGDQHRGWPINSSISYSNSSSYSEGSSNINSNNSNNTIGPVRRRSAPFLTGVPSVVSAGHPRPRENMVAVNLVLA